ncbi:MAG: hypothetical protein CME06_17785 [Gemmatimonadetes bacterium]|nr:hypothetical protein [Gemmatimonadota bacterium]
MSKKLEKALEEVRELRADPRAEGALERFRAILATAPSHAVAAAARLAAEAELGSLEDDLAAAFKRLVPQGAKSDPGCAAKAAIADALYRLDRGRESVHRRGVRMRQMEPVWGGQADTAAELRAICALGLVRMNHPDAMGELAELLADTDTGARIAAARAFAYAEDPVGGSVLRHKLLLGDEETAVISECMRAMLRLSPAAALDLAGRLLRRSETERSEAVALALGESHDPAAVELLIAWAGEAGAPRDVALLALATARTDAAFDHLFAMVASADGPSAREAIDALAIHRHDEALMDRLRRVAADRDDVDLRGALAKALRR